MKAIQAILKATAYPSKPCYHKYLTMKEFHKEVDRILLKLYLPSIIEWLNTESAFVKLFYNTKDSLPPTRWNRFKDHFFKLLKR